MIFFDKKTVELKKLTRYRSTDVFFSYTFQMHCDAKSLRLFAPISLLTQSRNGTAYRGVKREKELHKRVGNYPSIYLRRSLRGNNIPAVSRSRHLSGREIEHRRAQR